MFSKNQLMDSSAVTTLPAGFFIFPVSVHPGRCVSRLRFKLKIKHQAGRDDITIKICAFE